MPAAQRPHALTDRAPQTLPTDALSKHTARRLGTYRTASRVLLFTHRLGYFASSGNSTDQTVCCN